MLRFMARVRGETGATLTELNLGGGFGIRYTDRDQPKPFGAYMKQVSAVMSQTAAELDFPLPFIILEPGRSVAAPAGITLYTVGAVKSIPGVREYRQCGRRHGRQSPLCALQSRLYRGGG